MKIDRSLRVFVSSTFRDMGAERDHLARFIFPQLRKACEQRGVTWGEVDLRWGIPDEDKEDILAICLNEIERCLPYFIGILGERYGYVPELIPPDLLETYPWIETQTARSVTELEMRLGCLAREGLNPQAHFYFRSSSYLEHLPTGAELSDFDTTSDQDKQKLFQLKQEIRDASRQGGCSLREGYESVQELGEWILEDLTRLLDREFPADQAPGLHERESADHLSFAYHQTQACIERRELILKLDSFISSNEPPLVFNGEAGIGKSALLANWYFHAIQRQSDAFIMIHFIGSSGESARPTHILNRIMREMQRDPRLNPLLPQKLPADPESDFPVWISQAASEHRIILILDGLNYIEGNGAHELGWLPEILPANCRLILSTTGGRTLEVASRRGWSVLPMPLFTIEERKQLLETYLASYSRRLSPARVKRIIEAEPAGNPLYLRVLLEELRQTGQHEYLEEQIEFYLQSRTITRLFAAILERLERDYQPERELVRKSLSWIACSRRGLSEAELLDMLGDGTPPMPMRWWTPFSLALEPFMLSSSGLLNFANPSLRQAVHDRYLHSDELKKKAHQRLAAYFAFLPIPVAVEQDDISFQASSTGMMRVLEELPWQEARAGQWQNLMDTLTLPSLIEALEDRKLEWLEYLQLLRQAEAREEIKSLDIPSLFREAFQHFGARHQFVLAGSLGQFMLDAGFPAAADEYFKYEQENYPEDAPAFLRAAVLNDRAQILVEQGMHSQALTLFEQAEGFLRSDMKTIDDRRCMASVLLNRANLMREIRIHEGVEAILNESLVLMKETSGAAETATVLQSLGNYFMERGDTQKAISLHRQAYELRRKTLGPHHRDVGISLANLGNLLVRDGKFFQGIECLNQSVTILERTVGREHAFTRYALENLASVSEAGSARPESKFGLALLAVNTIPTGEGSFDPHSPESQRRMAVELEETLVEHWDDIAQHKTSIPVLLVVFPGFETVVDSVIALSIAKGFPAGLLQVLQIPAVHSADASNKVWRVFADWLRAHPIELMMVKPFSNHGAVMDWRVLEHFHAIKPPTPKGLFSRQGNEDIRPVILETVPFDGLDGPITGLYKIGNESRPALLPSSDWRRQNYKPQAADMRATGTMYFNLPLIRYTLSRNKGNPLDSFFKQALQFFAGGDLREQPHLYENTLRDLAVILKIGILNCERERGSRGYRNTSKLIKLLP